MLTKEIIELVLALPGQNYQTKMHILECNMACLPKTELMLYSIEFAVNGLEFAVVLNGLSAGGL